MKYIDITTNANGWLTIDGYSARKTVAGAIADMGRYIADHVDEEEGKAMMKYKEECLLPAKESDGGYFMEVDEVGSAVKVDEDGVPVAYSEANFYVVCRILRG